MSWFLRTVTVWQGCWGGTSEVSTHARRDSLTTAQVGGQTGTRAAQEGLFLVSLEQGGSDKLLGDQGITASPASSLDLLVLAIRMACRISELNASPGGGSPAGEPSELGAEQRPSHDNAGDHPGVNKDVAVLWEKAAGSLQTKQ